MVELRKRKGAPDGSQGPPPVKKANSVKSSTSSKKEDSSNGKSTPKKLAAGDTVTLEGFGGEIETHDGEKTTLKKLVEDCKAGLVIFTYPKASTPGCKCHVRSCHYARISGSNSAIVLIMALKVCVSGWFLI